MERIQTFISNLLFVVSLSIILGIIGYNGMLDKDGINLEGLEEIKVYESFYERNIPEIEIQEEIIVPQIIAEPIVEYNSGDMVGTISFLDNTLPLYYGHEDSVLDKGTGIEDRVLDLPGRGTNSVIYGHREQHFWDLQYLCEGDLISITIGEEELDYEVYLIERRMPNDAAIYEEEDSDVITLVTCYPFVWMGKVTDRYIIKAKLVR